MGTLVEDKLYGNRLAMESDGRDMSKALGSS